MPIKITVYNRMQKISLEIFSALFSNDNKVYIQTPNPKTSRMILHSKSGNHHICQEAVDPLTDGGGDRKLCQLFLKGDGVKAELKSRNRIFVC